jgi:hypothetical protein
MKIALGLLLLAGRAIGGEDSFEQMKSLAGEWRAELPGYGTIDSSIRLVSNGKAIEETIGTAADNEVSIYSRDNGRVLLTHFCAMTSDGHQVRMQSEPGRPLEFRLTGSVNLRDDSAPHMRRMILTFVDKDHFEERWTKTQDGKDTLFDLKFTRRQPK